MARIIQLLQPNEHIIMSGYYKKCPIYMIYLHIYLHIEPLKGYCVFTLIFILAFSF